MITGIQYTGQVKETGSRLVNKQRPIQNTETNASEANADFSKLLFDAFREQNRSFATGTAQKPSGVSVSGGTNVSFCWGKSGVTVSNEEMNRIFGAAAEKYQVPVALLKAVAKAESNFSPNEVSSSGAMGVMQLMPETAKGLGVSDPFDVEQNIMGGAKYLADKLAMYDGNVELALAAYNAGSGNVKKYGGIPPFTETQTYIKKVLAYMEMNNG
ncbi:MAG: lytic transglycosylase domain-containing protein [Acetivibrio ethanolgignens]